MSIPSAINWRSGPIWRCNWTENCFEYCTLCLLHTFLGLMTSANNIQLRSLWCDIHKCVGVFFLFFLARIWGFQSTLFPAALSYYPFFISLLPCFWLSASSKKASPARWANSDLEQSTSVKRKLILNHSYLGIAGAHHIICGTIAFS